MPVQRAPRGPVIVPDGTMPEAARERLARPPAGTALAPLSGSHLESALVERAGAQLVVTEKKVKHDRRTCSCSSLSH
jgi:hypothetical protein